jgi:hypothetical protein
MGPKLIPQVSTRIQLLPEDAHEQPSDYCGRLAITNVLFVQLSVFCISLKSFLR